MMELLTFGILLVMAMQAWQIFFNTNIVLFDRKSESYKNFSIEFSKFYALAENFHTTDPGKGYGYLDNNRYLRIKENKRTILQAYADLNGAVETAFNLFKSQEIKIELTNCLSESKSIVALVYLIWDESSKPKDISGVLKTHLETKSMNQEYLYSLFKPELKLKTFSYYIGYIGCKFCSKFN